jgi:hypothetical protein
VRRSDFQLRGHPRGSVAEADFVRLFLQSLSGPGGHFPFDGVRCMRMAAGSYDLHPKIYAQPRQWASPDSRVSRLRQNVILSRSGQRSDRGAGLANEEPIAAYGVRARTGPQDGHGSCVPTGRADGPVGTSHGQSSLISKSHIDASLRSLLKVPFGNKRLLAVLQRRR